MSRDPQIRELAVQTARAYATAGRLAHELDQTIRDLTRHLHRPEPEREDDDGVEQR